MLKYEDIADLVGEYTAAEIATALNADTRHKRDCWATKQDADAASPDLLFMLTARYDVLSLDKSAAWTGPLIDAIEATGNAALIAGFNKLLTQLQITGRKVLAYSDDTGLTGYLVTAIAGIVGQLVEARGQGATASQVIADVYTLTGGPRYSGVTTEQVQAVIDRQAKLEAIETAVSAEQAAQQPHIVATQRLQSVTVNDYTAEQLATEIARILAYPETWPVGGE